MPVTLKRKSPGSVAMTPLASSSPSPKNALVRAVEKSMLRTLAFVLYHLDRSQAQFCVHSILQWYRQLQRRLPRFATESLEKCATSFVALSDAEFTAFWLSLAEEPDSMCCSHTQDDDSTSIECGTHSDEDQYETYLPCTEERDATLVMRLYRQISQRIQRVFGLPTCAMPPHQLVHAQTPLTSPDDKYDERQFYTRPTNVNLAVATTRANSSSSRSSNGSSDCGLDQRVLSQTVDRDTARGEPGWAVEYMEQESKVSSEITQRMRRMMHSSIPLNLFRAKVVYPDRGEGELAASLEACGFIGVVSPESFPPTPITRDLQTRRIHHYTATVLDHATLALRLLEANYYTR